MSKQALINKYLIRLLITFILAVVFVLLISEGAFLFQKDETDREPEIVELIIPSGTAARIANGEPVPAIPETMTFVVGDMLVVKNDDLVNHQLGPHYIPPGTSAQLVLDSVEKYAYSCSFQPTQYLGLNVELPTTFWTRIQALGFAVPPTTVFFFLNSLLIFPIQSPAAKSADTDSGAEVSVAHEDEVKG
jgi:hypothetical protein